MTGDAIIPFGPLGIIALRGTEEMAKKIDQYIVKWRRDLAESADQPICSDGFVRETYIINADFVRFQTGEGKCVIHDTVRDFDIYFLIDPFNYGVSYTAYGTDFPMSPDDHFADLKRAIGACAGKPRRISVIMPMLYGGRQHRRTTRESLDCAIALQELTNMGVENILTFDAHDPRVQNAIPLKGFENVTTSYQMLKALCNNFTDVSFDKDHLIIVSPDEGGLQRCIYYSHILKVNLGTFYKRRDYSRVINGRNPIIAHEYLGEELNGKDAIVIDDMIASGQSMLDVCKQLKERGANRIFIFSAFGLFTEGLDLFDKYYEDGMFSAIFTTNTVYQTKELLSKPWYRSVEMSKFIAYLIDYLNSDKSISPLLSPNNKIKTMLIAKGYKTEEDFDD